MENYQTIAIIIVVLAVLQILIVRFYVSSTVSSIDDTIDRKIHKGQKKVMSIVTRTFEKYMGGGPMQMYDSRDPRYQKDPMDHRDPIDRRDSRDPRSHRSKKSHKEYEDSIDDPAADNNQADEMDVDADPEMDADVDMDADEDEVEERGRGRRRNRDDDRL